MGYKLLSSAFYEGQDAYDKLYNSRINSESAYKFDFKIKDNQAFAIINNQVLEKVDKILDLNCKLNVLIQSLPKEASEQYAKRCLLDEIYLTNNIEGVYSTRTEINELLETKVKPKKYKRLYALVKKYEALLNNSEIKLNSCEDIRMLYDDFMLKDVIKEDETNAPDGKLFRINPVYIMGKHGNTVHSGICPEEEIIKCMSESLNMVNNDEYNFLIRVAVFHYMFGYIHPFYDGNGRMSRFISSYLLSQKLHYLVSCRLACAVKNKLPSYYKGFNIVNDDKNKGDVTPFILKFMEIIIDAEEELYEALLERKQKLLFYLNKIESVFEDIRVAAISKILVQNTLFGNIGLSVEGLCDTSGFGTTKVRKVLKELDEKDMLIKGKSGRTLVYDMNLDKLI